MVNNFTIADNSRIKFLISMMVKYGINTPVHIQKDNGVYWFVFENEVSFISLSNFVKDFNSYTNNMIEIDWDANQIFVRIPSVWD